MTNTPNFVSIGPGRCGTTWLYETLSAHPEVQMARIKETEFFNTNYDKGPTWYEEHFPGGAFGAVGEISNNYYLDAAVADRLAEYRPEMKLILSLRNPRTLLKSFHGFAERRGLEPPPLAEFINQPIGPVMGSGYASREKSGRLTTADTRTVLESVLLGERFAPFYEAFDRSQIYVLVYERLRSEPTEVIREIYDFLEVDSRFQPEFAETVINEAVAPRSSTVARLASKGAYLARAVGAYRVLRWGHRSKTVKRLLYTKSGEQTPSGGGELAVPPRALDRVGPDLQRLLEVDPSLATRVAQY